MNVLILTGALAIWGIIHSLTASLAFKDRILKMAGNRSMHFYRLGYNFLSVISFAPILWLMWALPDRVLYTIPAPWRYFMLFGQGVAAFLLAYGILQTDALSFIGLRQPFTTEAEPVSLITGGLYRFVRHPLYSAGLIFLWLTVTMTINQLIVYGSATIYIFIGAYFEERKLLHEYGEIYADYRASTPMIIPGLLLKRKKKSS